MSLTLSPVEQEVVSLYETLRQSVAPVADSVQSPAHGRLDCPSVPLLRGGTAIAVRGSSSENFEFLGETFPVSPESLSESLAASVQTRLRLAGPCIRSACESWTLSGCRLGRAVASVNRSRSETQASCTIRDTCRWIAENGESVCHTCPSLAY